MEYIDIAATGVRASRVGLGAWAIGGWMWGIHDPVGPEFMAPPTRSVA